MNYCLDTNVIIDFLRGDKGVLEKMQELQVNNNLCTTIITLCELYKGAYLSSKQEEDIVIVESLANSLKIINLEKESCKIFGQEYFNLKKKGKLTEDIDLIIGSICIANNKILITKNKKHFENINNLKLELF